MRRPLFTTGVPQNPPAACATPTDALTLLDSRDLDAAQQSITRFVTLYAYNQSTGSSDVVTIASITGSDTPVVVVNVALPTGIGGVPVKILDRYPLRGNKALLACTDVGDAPFVWGYFEVDGAASQKAALRPLQAGDLASPFTYAPVYVTMADPGPETLHTLSTTYVDLITLDLSARVTGSVGSVIVTDGTDTATIDIGGVVDNTRLFDEIPMMAAAAGGALSLAGGSDGDDVLVGWGSFSRVI